MYPYLFGVIETYTVMLVIGIIAGLGLFEWYLRGFLKEDSKKLFYLEFPLLIAVIIGIAGAYITQNIYDFISNPSGYHWSWSLTFYGGLIFGVGSFFLIYFLYGRKHYPDGIEKILWIAPASIALAHAFGRMGCFFEGCCYGLPTNAWYGIQFVTTTEKVIPTNLFEAIFLFLLAGGLLFLAIKFRSPYSVSIYLIGYGIWRFFIEFARGDYRGSFVPGLTPSQFWSILLVLLGIGYIVFRVILSRRKDMTPKES